MHVWVNMTVEGNLCMRAQIMVLMSSSSFNPPGLMELKITIQKVSLWHNWKNLSPSDRLMEMAYMPNDSRPLVVLWWCMLKWCSTLVIHTLNEPPVFIEPGLHGMDVLTHIVYTNMWFMGWCAMWLIPRGSKHPYHANHVQWTQKVHWGGYNQT